MNWFRVYHDIIDDPKILALPRAFRWHFIELLAVSSRQVCSEFSANSTQTHRGSLPPMKEIAIHLRLSLTKTRSIVATFIENGFIDVSDCGKTLSIHGWNKRQFKSDDVTARSSASMQRSRERSQSDPVNVHVNVPDTETDTETDKTPHKPPEGRVVFVLPDWIPEADWKDYLDSRKKKASPAAKRLAVGKLTQLQADGEDVAAVLQQSTLHGWPGLYPVKANGNGYHKPGTGPSPPVNTIPPDKAACDAAVADAVKYRKVLDERNAQRAAERRDRQGPVFE